MSGTVVGYDVAAIQRMFCDYVGSEDGKNRHTPEANHQLGMYSAFTAGAFQMNSRLQADLYNRMMDCAVEFEESGFIAGFGFGFRCALSLLQASTSPASADLTPITPEAEKKVQAAPQPPTDTDTPTPSNSKGKVDSDSGGEGLDPQETPSISSRKIAEMFEVTHGNVVRRIENMILPRLDTESKQFFRLDLEMTRRHRRYKVYRLNKAACDLYIAEMESYKQYVNVIGGLEKMRELMRTIFPVDVNAS